MSALLWTLAVVCWGLAAVLVGSLATKASSHAQAPKKPRR
jgi:hypothetical protein